MTYEEAKKHLEEYIKPNGGSYSVGWYLAWSPGREEATLDGQFTADDLLAISVYMRGPEQV